MRINRSSLNPALDPNDISIRKVIPDVQAPYIISLHQLNSLRPMFRPPRSEQLKHGHGALYRHGGHERRLVLGLEINVDFVVVDRRPVQDHGWWDGVYL
jgi:hypothetical protein